MYTVSVFSLYIYTHKSLMHTDYNHRAESHLEKLQPANSSAPNQEIPLFSCNLQVYCCPQFVVPVKCTVLSIYEYYILYLQHVLVQKCTIFREHIMPGLKPIKNSYLQDSTFCSSSVAFNLV